MDDISVNKMGCIERNRFCKYCGEHFYANNLRKVFCSNLCADRSYNERRHIKSLRDHYQSLDPATFKYAEEPESLLQRNLKILEGLNIEPGSEKILPVDELEYLGFDFKQDGYFRKKVYYPKSRKKMFFLRIFQFKLYRYNDIYIHIKHNKS